MDLLKEFDDISIKGFDEHSVAEYIEELIKDQNSDKTIFAEKMAFNFMESYPNKENGWGTYYGPLMIIGDFEFPSIKEIDNEMIDYWEKRGNESNNPILKARYLGLVIDFKQKIKGEKVGIDIVNNYINTTILMAEGNYSKEIVYMLWKLERALNLAIRYSQEELKNSTKETLIKYEKENSVDDSMGLWGYSMKWLIKSPKIFTSEETKIIIKDYHDRLERALTKKDKDFYTIERICLDFADYYNNNNREEVKQYLELIEKIGNSSSEKSTAFQTYDILERVKNSYKKYGFKEETDRILALIPQKTKEVQQEMKLFKFEYKIPKEVIDETNLYIDKGSNVDEKLLRFIPTFMINSIEEETNQLKESVNRNPLQSIIPTTIFGEYGKTKNIKTINEDFESHLYIQIEREIRLESSLLRIIINHLKEDGIFTKDNIISFITKCPVVEEERIRIIERGLESYFQEDYLVTLHLLIPQIERILLKLLESYGGTIIKSDKKETGYQNRILDDLLRDKLLIDNLGEEFTTYLRILLTDTRGWNLRNDICHGMANKNTFNIMTADRTVHAIMAFGIYR